MRRGILRWTVLIALVALLLLPSARSSAAVIEVSVEPVATSTEDGEVPVGTRISLSTNTADAEIIYTLDGSDPRTSASAQAYAGPIHFDSPGAYVVSAYARAPGYTPSDRAVFEYQVVAAPSPVEASVSSGLVFAGSRIVLTTRSQLTTIQYTLDGTDPRSSASALIYSAPIVIAGETRVRAVAVAEGMPPSEVTSFQYSIYESPGTTQNLSDDFYNRKGLEHMPRIDYESMPVADVTDFGAVGDGKQPADAAFTRAVDVVAAVGGGIVYVPEGTYLFENEAQPRGMPSAYWHLSPRAPLGQMRRNIHFVGDGERSIIRFNKGGVHQGYFGAGSGWFLGSAKNISIRSLSFTWYPHFDMRTTYRSGYTINGGQKDYTTENVQIIDVHIDQGNIGIVFWRGQKNIWVVDCVVENLSADGIHFSEDQNVVAAYNYIEEAGDDSIATVSDVSKGVAASNNRFLYNTAIGARWGRGIIMGGFDGELTGNWIEQMVGAGIFINARGDGRPDSEGHPNVNTQVHDNVIIRSNLAERDDNLHRGNRTHGALKFAQEVENATMAGNAVYGSASHGINVGYHGGYAVDRAVGDKLRFQSNLIAGNLGQGMLFGHDATVDGLDLTGNTFLNNGAGSVLFDGSLRNIQSDGNIVSQAPVVQTEDLSGDLDSFTISDRQPAFVDHFYQVRTEESETAWELVAPYEVPDLPQANVRDFGARGDGKTNDLGAFYRAIEQLPDSGGVVYVPAGTYRFIPTEDVDSLDFTRIKHHLLVKGRKNIHIVGEDMDRTTILFGSLDHQGIKLLNVSDVSIRNVSLALTANSPHRNNRALLQIAASHNVLVKKVKVENPGIGVLIDSSTGVTVKETRVVNSNRYGIRIAASRQVWVDQSDIHNTRDHAIQVTHTGSVSREPQFVKIERTRVKGTAEGSGIAIANGNNILVQGNDIRMTHMAGIQVYQTTAYFPLQKVDIVNNTLQMTNNGDYTYMYGALTIVKVQKGFANISVLNNTIQDSRLSGMWVDKSRIRRLHIEGNRFSRVDGEHILISEAQLKQIDQVEGLASEPQPR